MNYRFYAPGECTYVGIVEASSKEEALRKIKDKDFDGVELMHEKIHLSSIDEINIEEETKYELNQFEFDLIQTYRDCYEICKFSDCKQLIELKDKGYFKCVDDNTNIQYVLNNCEVIK